jgi:hypothetical protein
MTGVGVETVDAIKPIAGGESDVRVWCYIKTLINLQHFTCHLVQEDEGSDHALAVRNDHPASETSSLRKPNLRN